MNRLIQPTNASGNELLCNQAIVKRPSRDRRVRIIPVSIIASWLTLSAIVCIGYQTSLAASPIVEENTLAEVASSAEMGIPDQRSESDGQSGSDGGERAQPFDADDSSAGNSPEPEDATLQQPPVDTVDSGEDSASESASGNPESSGDFEPAATNAATNAASNAASKSSPSASPNALERPREDPGSPSKEAGQSKDQSTATVDSDGSIGFPSHPWWNTPTSILMGAVLVVLGIATLVGRYLRRQPTEYVNPALVRRFRQRLNVWWLMCAILVFGIVLQQIGTVIVFAIVSFWALREFITMTPTRRGDHRALFWALIVITPGQYLLIALENRVSWQPSSGFYGLYSILIPVYASLLIPARVALSGDHKRFLERSAQITFGLLICVYSLSFAPALINLSLKDSYGNVWSGSPAGLLFFLVLMSQLSDILQWTWGHFVGRRMIAPEISSSRTWEGFIGGTLSTGMIGAVLYGVTPFRPWEAACMSMVVAVMGMFGGMTMSAIKRDRGVNDYGSLVVGHAGVLDRIDTLCFAAPVFFHLTRFFFS